MRAGIPPHVQRLLRTGLLTEALQALRAEPASSDKLLRILIADLAYHTGSSSNRATQDICRSILRAAPSGELLARAALLLASALGDDGHWNEALPLLERSLDAARQTTDSELAVHVGVKLMKGLLETQGPGSLRPLAGEVRRHAARTGDPQIHALLHVRLGELEARLGSLETASRHLIVADQLLSTDPNYYIEGTLRLSQSVLEAYSSNHERALAAALAAIRLARRSGHRFTLISGTLNAGLLSVQTGRLDEAEQLFASIEPQARGQPALAMALLDNLAELRLLQGQFEEAEALIERVQALASEHPSLRSSWQYVGTSETRLRILRHRNPAMARYEARRAVAAAEAFGDRLLANSLRLLEADILIDANERSEAADRIMRTLADRDRFSLLMLGELNRVQARLALLNGDLNRANNYLNNATLVMAEVGTALSRRSLADVETQFETRGISAKASAACWNSTEAAARADEFYVALASVIDAAERPRLIANYVANGLAKCPITRRVILARRYGERTEEVTLAERRGARSGEVVRREIELLEPDTAASSLILEVEPSLRGVETADAIRKVIEAALASLAARRQELLRKSLWPLEPQTIDFEGIVGSTVMQAALEDARRCAEASLPALITGETGTGKELVAKHIHRLSPAAAGPFMPFNCSAVPRDMLASQLFGYRRGAFTGAVDNFPGIIRAAASGTLFLDEIGELSLEAQPKLLRFLESSEIHPLGELQPIRVNVRVVAATNVHLEKLMQEGRFREDLYYRLNVARIHLPPLRERREEIPALVDFYLDKYSQESRRARLRVSDEALEFLMLYNWPGNIRQLANEIRRIVAFAEPGSMLVPSMLAPEIQASRRTIDASQPVVGPNEMVVRIDQPLDAAVAELERAMIERALADSHGHLETAAERLGISRKGLFLKRRRLGLAN